MQKLLFIFSLLAGFTSAAQQSDPFSWLIGQWNRTGMSPGKEAREIWNVENGVLKGMGISLKNGDTTFVEKLSIRQIDGQYYYIADVPQNPEPVKFKITEMRSGFFLAENPEHDFPKAIRYELNNDRLEAEISGNGQVIPFVFQRIP